LLAGLDDLLNIDMDPPDSPDAKFKTDLSPISDDVDDLSTRQAPTSSRRDPMLIITTLDIDDDMLSPMQTEDAVDMFKDDSMNSGTSVKGGSGPESAGVVDFDTSDTGKIDLGPISDSEDDLVAGNKSDSDSSSSFSEEDGFNADAGGLGGLPDFKKPSDNFLKPTKKNNRAMTLDKAWNSPDTEKFKMWTAEAAAGAASLENAWEKHEELDLSEDSDVEVKTSNQNVDFGAIVKEKVLGTQSIDEVEKKVMSSQVDLEDMNQTQNAIEMLLKEKADADRKASVLHMLEELIMKNKLQKKQLFELKRQALNKKVIEEDDSTEEDIIPQNDPRQVPKSPEPSFDNFANQEDARHELAKTLKLLEESREERKRLSAMFVNEVERMRNIIRQLTQQSPKEQMLTGLARATSNFSHIASQQIGMWKERYWD